LAAFAILTVSLVLVYGLCAGPFTDYAARRDPSCPAVYAIAFVAVPPLLTAAFVGAVAALRARRGIRTGRLMLHEIDAASAAAVKDYCDCSKYTKPSGGAKPLG
jgi:hypothetical protein